MADALALVQKCCCSFSWLRVDDDSDNTTIIPISHRKTALPQDLISADKVPVPEKPRPDSHPRYINVKQRTSNASQRPAGLTKNVKLARSDSALSHFSAIFPAEDVSLGQAVLDEVRTRNGKFSQGLERFISDLEEHGDFGDLIENLAEIRKSGKSSRLAEDLHSIFTDEMSSDTGLQGADGSSVEGLAVADRGRALKKLLLQLEEQQKVEIGSTGTTSGFESVRKASCDLPKGRSKSQEVQDSGCSCHDTSSEHGTVKSVRSLSLKNVNEGIVPPQVKHARKQPRSLSHTGAIRPAELLAREHHVETSSSSGSSGMLMMLDDGAASNDSFSSSDKEQPEPV